MTCRYSILTQKSQASPTNKVHTLYGCHRNSVSKRRPVIISECVCVLVSTRDTLYPLIVTEQACRTHSKSICPGCCIPQLLYHRGPQSCHHIRSSAGTHHWAPPTAARGNTRGGVGGCLRFAWRSGINYQILYGEVTDSSKLIIILCPLNWT